MKVLHLSSEKSWRGGEQQIAYLIEELNTLGVTNYVACKQNSEFEKYCIKNAIEHLSLPLKNSIDLKTALKLKVFCNNSKIDIIHMHSGKSHSIGVISSVFGNKSSLILSRRVDFPLKNNWFSNWKYNHLGIKKIICVSEKIKTIIGPKIKIKSKIEVAHSGIDLNRFNNIENKGILHKEFGLSKNTKIIANISALADHKDYPTFINTAEKYINSYSDDVHFFIIGDGALKSELESIIKIKKLSSKITMTGFRNDIAEILPEIDVFLITSKEEGLGTTVLDAFANKVPVIATAGGGIPEMVINNKTGLLCNIGDSTCLAKNINEVLLNSTLEDTLTNNAYALLKKQFTKESTASKTYNIYQSIYSVK